MKLMDCRAARQIAVVLALWAVGYTVVAAPPEHAVVAGFERFYAADGADRLAGGRLLLGELGCLACHQADPAAAVQGTGKQAPVLDEVGQRVRPEFVRAFLAAPQQAKPGTTMPDMFAGLPAPEKAQQIEALVHFLAATGRLREAAPITAGVRRGEQLFHTVGCAACHNPRRAEAIPLVTSVPLPLALEEKYSVPGLAEFLQDPLAVRPGGRMPHLNLSDEEARDIACYLLRELEIEATLQYAYYEGNWQELPDFARLTPKARGQAASFDVNLGKPDHFGVVFRGLIRIDRDGRYTFHLGSDDGSRLRINGRQVAVMDGVHPLSFAAGSIDLKAGVHDLEAEYFEQGGEQLLRIEFEGPDVKRQSVEYALTPSRDDPRPDARFVVDAALANEGQRLFTGLGCAACHQLRRGDTTLTAQRTARPLAELDVARGCASGSAQRGIPHYALTARQRTALAAALAAGRSPPAEPAAGEVVAHTLAAFNCYACHQRDGRGGVEEPRNALFVSNQPEMGDEGRLPPPLDGVGAKLKADWMRHVFASGAKDRPYMLTRMPRFGAGNVEQLAAAFETLDAAQPLDVASDVAPRRLKAAGRKLAGERGYSCIKCHTWGNVKATGIQSISMTTMTRRLKEGWFHRYLLEPSRYRPGTRMPAAWPMGQVLLPNVLDGTAITQIHSLWVFLQDGDDAPMPLGLESHPIELVAEDRPILYRNFIDGAGARGIAVGYPEKVNIAYDANNLRLALVWHNAFIDASKHWVGRGSGFQGPLGDNVLKLHDGVPLAELDDFQSPWPTAPAKQQGYQFAGYRLDAARRPTFLYRWGDVAVEDFVEPVSRQEFTPLRRTLRVKASAPRDKAWFRAAAAGKIEAAEDGWFVIDGDYRLRVAAPGGAVRLRESGGRVELLVPVARAAGGELITQEIVW